MRELKGDTKSLRDAIENWEDIHHSGPLYEAFERVVKAAERRDQAVNALKGLLGIVFRLPGYPDPTCRVCRENAEAISAAERAVASAEESSS